MYRDLSVELQCFCVFDVTSSLLSVCVEATDWTTGSAPEPAGTPPDATPITTDDLLLIQALILSWGAEPVVMACSDWLTWLYGAPLSS